MPSTNQSAPHPDEEQPLRFSDLVSVHRPPSEASPAERTPISTHSNTNAVTDDPINNGFVSGLVHRQRGARLRPSRRGFLRGALAATSAATAASFTTLFGPGREVAAQTGVVGSYPRRLLTFCPPYNSGDNCQPGCGSSPICTDCCTSDGYFRNDPANGYSLYAGGCGDGDIADGWIWRYQGVCGSCSTIEYRCSDGYVQTDTGPAPFICRTVTDCVPLKEGQEADNDQPDAARPTNWRPAGALEVAIDNGGTVTMNGWISDGTDTPVGMRIRANQRIVHFGTAALVRGDIQQRIAGAGPNTGFNVSFPLEPGQYELCVDALSGVLNATVGCISMSVGSGGSVRGPGEVGSPRATPTPEPTAEPSETPNATTGPAGSAPTPTPPAAAAAAPVVRGLEVSLPPRSSSSPSPTLGALQVLRRSGTDTGFASGWAGDLDTATPAYIEVSVDGQAVAVVQTELPRPDVQQAHQGLGSNCGFAVTFALPADQANVCVDAVGADDGRRRLLGCRTLGADLAPEPTDQPARPTASGSAAVLAPTVYGAFERVEVIGGQVVAAGWAFAPDAADTAVVIGIEIEAARAETVADGPHAGVRSVYGVAGDHGFELGLSAASGQAPVRLFAQASDGSQVLLEERVVEIA